MHIVLLQDNITVIRMMMLVAKFNYIELLVCRQTNHMYNRNMWPTMAKWVTSRTLSLPEIGSNSWLCWNNGRDWNAAVPARTSPIQKHFTLEYHITAVSCFSLLLAEIKCILLHILRWWVTYQRQHLNNDVKKILYTTSIAY